MELTAKHLHERYSSMDTEELADIYHAGALTDLSVSVLKEVITSRGLDWAQFTNPPSIELESEPIGLVGVKGWLLFYAILRGLGSAVILSMQYREIPDVEERLTGIFVLIVVLVGLYLLSVVRRPVTRYYHIGINSLWAALFAGMAFVTPTPVIWLANCVEVSIWAAYWIRSKRVRATYCQGAGTVTTS